MNSKLKKFYEDHKIELLGGTVCATAAFIYIGTVRVAAREGALAAVRAVNRNKPFMIHINPQEVASDLIKHLGDPKIIVDEKAMAETILAGIKQIKKAK